MKNNYVRRYLLDIKLAKWGFICLAALIICYTICVFFLNKAEHKFNFHSHPSSEGNNIDNPPQEKALLVQAVFHGQDKDGQPFHIKAKRAAQTSPNDIKLQDIQAEFVWKRDILIHINSVLGLLKQREKIIELNRQITVQSANGYNIATDDLLVNYATNQAKITTGVNIESPFGRIYAQELLADKNLEHIVFTGNVHVTLYPNKLR